MLPFSRYRALLDQLPALLFRVAKWHADSLSATVITYFHPDGKAINIFPTDSDCSPKLGFLNPGTTDILTWGVERGDGLHIVRGSDTVCSILGFCLRWRPSSFVCSLLIFNSYIYQSRVIYLIWLASHSNINKNDIPHFCEWGTWDSEK